MNKIRIVAKREYLKVIKKWSFWLSTLLIPVLIVVIMIVSTVASIESSNKIIGLLDKNKTIIIFDEPKILKEEVLKDKYIFVNNFEKGKKSVIDKSSELFIYIPRDLSNDNPVQVHIQDQGTFASLGLDDSVSKIITESVYSNLSEFEQRLLQERLPQKTYSYKDGIIVDSSPAKLILPIGAIIIYIILTMFATNYLLASVSEEKENRIIEIILSTVSTRDLIWGKIIGQIGVVLTQVGLLLFLPILGFIIIGTLSSSALNIDLGITPIQVILAIFYVFINFLTIAALMVGAGAAMPSYNDSQNFATVFIMIGIAPLYFITALLADPSGTVSTVLSYTPLTAGLVLMFRNAMNAISPVEIIISGIVLIFYAYVAMVLAFKLFEFGSLEYGKRISFLDFGKGLIKKK